MGNEVLSNFRKDLYPLRGGSVAPYELLMKLVDSLPKQKEDQGSVGIRRVEIYGEIDGSPAHLVYDCFSGPHRKWGIGGRPLGTGVPASLGAQWLVKGRIKPKGVVSPEMCLEPEPFMHELGQNGRGIVTTMTDGETVRHF